MKRERVKQFLALGLVFAAAVCAFWGCGSSGNFGGGTAADGKKTFVFGDTTFNAENGESDINPHRDSGGWACIRYGVGETLFRFSDSMELEPWLAVSYENVDELTWEITLRDGVYFTSGRYLDGEAVRECLEALIADHPELPGICISRRLPRRGRK